MYSKSNRAVFIDRDGVINEAIVVDGKPYPPPSLAEFKICPKVKEGLDLLSNAGYLNIVVTNQPDVRTGKQSRCVVESFHAKLKAELPIHAILACYHIDRDNCNCRKPKPGMLLQAALQWSIELDCSHLVGDRWKDIEAGRSAGVATYWLSSGYNEPAPKSPDFVVDSLFKASQLIVKGDAQIRALRG